MAGSADVDHDEVHVGLAHDALGVVEVPVALVVLELQDAGWQVGVHDVDVARLQRVGALLRVGDGSVGDRVEIGEALAPVVGVALGGEVVVGDPFLELEGPGADRMLRSLGIGDHRGGGDVAGLAADAPGQVGRKRHPRLLECHGDGVRARGRDVLHGSEGHSEQVVLEVVQAPGDGRGITGGAVVEPDVGTGRDRPYRVVRVGGDGLGEIGLDTAVGGDDGERVEDRAGVENPGLVEAPRRRVESLFFGLDPEDELPALLGGGGGDAVAGTARERPPAVRARSTCTQQARPHPRRRRGLPLPGHFEPETNGGRSGRAQSLPPSGRICTVSPGRALHRPGQ